MLSTTGGGRPSLGKPSRQQRGLAEFRGGRVDYVHVYKQTSETLNYSSRYHKLKNRPPYR